MSKTKDCEILQITEPTIQLRPLMILDTEKSKNENGTEGSAASKIPISKLYQRIPYISINGYDVESRYISAFELDCTGFVPRMTVQFGDMHNTFVSKYFPKDGAIIQLYIASPGDESIYKPIRIDFILTGIRNIGSTGDPTVGSGSVFRITGDMRIPKGMGRFNYVDTNTSFNTLLNLSTYLELGFASNIESTDDEQTWINEFRTLKDYSSEIIEHAYSTDDDFYCGFIDPYYVLNFVEVDRLFTTEGNKEDKECKIFNTTPAMQQDDEEIEKNNMMVVDSYYYITNSDKEPGSGYTNYIVDYSEISNVSSTINSGYRKYVQYYDFDNDEFVSEYVDSITHNTEGMLAMNKGQMLNGEPEDGLRDSLASYVNYGIQTFDNIHSNYRFAEIQNRMNNEDAEKVGLNVVLENFNPAITRYSRLWVEIYDKNLTSIEDNNVCVDSTVETNTNPPKVMNETEGPRGATINESLTGWYVVKGFKLVYNIDTGSIEEHLDLMRREAKPAITTDYK